VLISVGLTRRHTAVRLVIAILAITVAYLFLLRLSDPNQTLQSSLLATIPTGFLIFVLGGFLGAFTVFTIWSRAASWHLKVDDVSETRHDQDETWKFTIGELLCVTSVAGPAVALAMRTLVLDFSVRESATIFLFGLALGASVGLGTIPLVPLAMRAGPWQRYLLLTAAAWLAVTGVFWTWDRVENVPAFEFLLAACAAALSASLSWLRFSGYRLIARRPTTRVAATNPSALPHE
jgi:hypothetical protein